MQYIGIDLGGTNIKAALVNPEGQVLAEASAPTGGLRPAEELCRDIAVLTDRLLAQANCPRDQVAALGMGCPGTVDDHTGVVVYANNLEWRNFPAGDCLGALTGLPVAIGNDANVAALAESLYGCARGAQSAVILTLGTGVGGGIVLDGRLWTGFNGAASELGHIVVEPEGVPCTCGRRGCLEMYASATGLLRMTREAMDAHPESAMHALAAKTGVDGRLPFAAAAAGDAAGQGVVDLYLKYLARGVVDIINLLFPEVIGFSGGVANQGEALLTPLRALVEPDIYGASDDPRHTRLVQCTMGYRAGTVGAAALARQMLESR